MKMDKRTLRNNEIKDFIIVRLKISYSSLYQFADIF
jgi:hypothetical protein